MCSVLFCSESSNRTRGEQECVRVAGRCRLAEGVGSDGPPLPMEPASSALSAMTTTGLVVSWSGRVAREVRVLLKCTQASVSYLIVGAVICTKPSRSAKPSGSQPCGSTAPSDPDRNLKSSCQGDAVAPLNVLPEFAPAKNPMLTYFSRCWPMLARFFRVGQTRTKQGWHADWDEIGHLWPTSGPKLARPMFIDESWGGIESGRPNLARLASKLGRKLANDGPSFIGVARIWPTLVQRWPNPRNVGRTRPILARIRTRPSLSKLSTMCKCCPDWPRSGRIGKLG